MVHTTDRDLYIDFAKGLACLVMAIGHTCYYTTWFPHSASSYVVIWKISEFAMPIFLFASGMNVVSQVKRMSTDKSIRPTLAFLGSVAWLFLLGFVYCINRRSLGMMDLFQCVAMGTALTYIVVRRQWPTWSLVLLGVGIFALSASFCYDPVPYSDELIKGIHLKPAGANVSGFVAKFQRDVIIGDIKKAAVLALPLWRRILYVHFAFAPWAGLFLFGVATKRLQGSRWMYGLWALGVALFLGGLYVPFYPPREDLGFYLRGKPDYVSRLLLEGLLLMVPLRRWYVGGVGKLRMAVELIGKESFVFFVVHWLIIWLSAVVFLAFRNYSYWAVWAVQVPLNLFLAYQLTKWVAAHRDRTIAHPRYPLKWFSVMIVGGALALFFEARDRMFLFQIFSIAASVSMAMLWPVGRNAIRGWVYRPRKIAA